MKKETLIKKKERVAKIIEILSQKYPDVKIQLEHKNPFQLLIATILSAQCTDARVNIVTQTLFKKYFTPEDYVKVDADELERDIFSTGFYKAKARNIKLCCEKLISEFNGQIPDNIEDLTKLAGVGRKTANVILGHCFNTPAIVVDTHVIRLSNRMGFVETENAEKIEYELMKIIPKEKWVIFTHYFINHGRNTCIRNPKCKECVVNLFCNYYNSTEII